MKKAEDVTEREYRKKRVDNLLPINTKHACPVYMICVSRCVSMNRDYF